MNGLFRPEWSTLKKLMFLQSASGGSYATITGNPVSFTSLAAPLRKLQIAFSPVQDLHGYDSPWPAGGGKNKIVPKDTTLTINGVSAVCSSSAETVTLTGTGTANGGRTIKLSELITLPAGTYRYRTYGNVNAGVALNDANNNVLGWGYTSFTLETETQVYFGVNIEKGKVYNETFRVCVTAEAEEQTAWTPYSNECPISGWDSLGVEQRGKNLYDSSVAVANERFNSTGTASASGTTRSDYIPCIGGASYYALNVHGSSVMAGVYWYDSNKAYISHETITGISPVSAVVTAPANAAYMGVNMPNASASSAAINYPATDTAYHAYNPLSRSISISLGSTVYSGWVDAVTGIGELDMVYGEVTKVWGVSTYSAWLYAPGQVALNKGEMVHRASYLLRYVGTSNTASMPDWSIAIKGGQGNTYGIRFDSNFASKADYDAYLAEHPLYVCLPLAAPQTIQLTPQEINSLAGENTMWTDGDSVTVEYRSN